ncbi:hypothetical protein ABW16_21610 [Mycolicibacter heraklionensis]|uniref:Uncharacterized protein n=1 Tax=Mycolicibacter heraklionensis TaxID=512402 RepID=A0ABR5FA31_9MYCO|nr:hypothetical protein [Mycolicibacter heraklionensis]KLO25908.1 hypothetical protein ABW16_21610 [Mycolicibacter heraklionensis]
MTGHVKHDEASESVAIRTHLPDEAPFIDKAWLVATARTGAQLKATADVESWPDLFVPETPQQ